MTLISDLQDQLSSAIAALGPVTVSIGRDHRGTGIVVGPDRVLTNVHNLRDRTVQVTFDGARAVQGTVLATDAARDLAVIDVDTAGVAGVEWSDVTPQIGTVVVATARDGGGLRATVGTISQESRSFRGP